MSVGNSQQARPAASRVQQGLSGCMQSVSLPADKALSALVLSLADLLGGYREHPGEFRLLGGRADFSIDRTAVHQRLEQRFPSGIGAAVRRHRSSGALG